jgi:hypothetical protein
MDYLVRNRRVLSPSLPVTQAYPGYPLLQWIDPSWAVLPPFTAMYQDARIKCKEKQS